MLEWTISPWGGVAYLVLRGEELTVTEAERLLEAAHFYYPNQRLRTIVDVRGLDPLPGPLDILVAGLEGQARTHHLRIKIMRDEPPSDPAPQCREPGQHGSGAR